MEPPNPAVSVLVLGMHWGGKRDEVFGFQLLSYAASIVLVPIAAYLLLGGKVDPTTLLVQLLAQGAIHGVERIGEPADATLDQGDRFLLHFLRVDVLCENTC